MHLRHDDGEFIAAQTRDGIGFARAATQPLGNELQQFVADRMPERIVDTLELVEIEAKHRQALPAFHALEFVLQPFAQQRAIGQICQGIMARHVADALHGALLFGDVLVGGEPPGALDRRADQRNDAAIGELGDAVKGFPVPDASGQPGDVVGRVARKGAGAPAAVEQVAKRAPRTHVVGAEPVHLEVARVADDQALF